MTPKKPKHPGGRPRTMKDGRRIQVYLDAASIKRAEKLGHGNVSEGIRIALAKASKEG